MAKKSHRKAPNPRPKPLSSTPTECALSPPIKHLNNSRSHPVYIRNGHPERGLFSATSGEQPQSKDPCHPAIVPRKPLMPTPHQGYPDPRPAIPCSILMSAHTHVQRMKRNLLISCGSYLMFVAAAFAQSGPVPSAPAANGGQPQQPVSYASVTQLNGLLSQLEATSKDTQADLVRLRIEKWKADGSYKKQALGNVDSIQRNLQGALPEIVTQLRNAPEDLPATFKLYRELDALYDVMGSVVEGTGAFGSKDDFQSISNDLTGFEAARKQLAERIENLASSKEAEIARLSTALKTAQSAVAAEPPKKIVVDDTEPPKSPHQRRRRPKSPRRMLQSLQPAPRTKIPQPSSPQPSRNK